jgi:hypothetical protein
LSLAAAVVVHGTPVVVAAAVFYRAQPQLQQPMQIQS